MDKEEKKVAKELSASAKKVQDILNSHGFTCQVVELPEITRTAKEAAQAIGCRVEQIAKSLVFKGKNTHKPILVIASGANRVNENRLGERVSEPVEKADADFIRERTGFVIGGVPPIGHLERLETFIDEDLLHHDEIWAAAGNPHAVFKLTPSDLKKMTDGLVISVK
jgi:prolyl-tRNA editing enzyme YbaK/EbsC (Cys-tRNA(Pro) deacylase)